jgi:WD40 repeat protein
MSSWPNRRRRFLLPLLVLLVAGRFASGGDLGKEAPRVDLHGDPLPAGALARLGSGRFYHAAVPPVVGFSPDSKLLLVAPREPGRHLFLWDLQQRKVVRRFGFSAADLIQVAFSADGRLIVVASERGVSFWDVSTGRELPRAFRETDGIITAALAPNGKTLAIGGNLRRGTERCCVVLWDLATGRELRTLTGHQTPVQALAFSADGARLTSCSVHVESGEDRIEGRVLVWEVGSGKVARQAKMPAAALTYPLAAAGGPLSPTKAVRLSRHGERLAFPDDKDEVHVWDVAANRELATVKADTTAFVFSPDGKGLATGGRTPVQLWDAERGTELRKLQGRRPEGAFVHCFSPDGKLLAAAGSYLARDTALHVWEVATGKEVLAPEGHTDTVMCIAFSADGKTILTGSADWRVHLWDMRGRELRRLTGAVDALAGVAVSPDRRQVAAIGLDRTADLWDLTTGTSTRVRRGAADGQAPGSSTHFGGMPAFTPDNKALLIATQQRVLERHELNGGTSTQALEGAEGGMTAAAFSPDAAFVAGAWWFFQFDPMGLFVIGNQGGLGIWDAGSGAALWKETDPTNPRQCWAVAFSPDGTLVAFSEARRKPDTSQWAERRICVRETATGREVRRIDLNEVPATGLAFAPDGRTLVSVHEHVITNLHDALVWDLPSGKEVRRLKGHVAQVTCVAFSPDGSRLATGSADNTVLVWDANSQQRPVPPRAEPFSAEEKKALWEALGATDAGVAYRAMWGLSAAPAQAVALLKESLQPEPGLDAVRIARLIRDLGSNRFAVREKASAALRKYGRVVEPALRAAVTKSDLSLELRRRVETILRQMKGALLTPGQVRTRRALTVLEWLGTSEARQVLETLSRGGEGLLMTHDARAALARLERRVGR